MTTELETALPLPAAMRLLAIDVRPGVDLQMVCYDADGRALAHHAGTVTKDLWRSLLLPALRSHCAHLGVVCEVREIRPKGHHAVITTPPLAALAAQ